MNIEVPHVTIPVRPGRDWRGLVEVAALDQKLKSHGQHGSMEFNQRLLNLMHRKHPYEPAQPFFVQPIRIPSMKCSKELTSSTPRACTRGRRRVS